MGSAAVPAILEWRTGAGGRAQASAQMPLLGKGSLLSKF